MTNNLRNTYKEIADSFKLISEEFPKINKILTKGQKIEQASFLFLGITLLGGVFIERGITGYDFAENNYNYSGIIGGLRSIKNILQGDKQNRKEALLNLFLSVFDSLLNVFAGLIFLFVGIALVIPTGICLLVQKGCNSFTEKILNQTPATKNTLNNL